MKKYDKKYGLDSDHKEVKKFHLERTMFAIINNKLYIASKQTIESHAEWFENLGFEVTEKFMDKNPRGFFDSSGIYFYKGYDFSIDKISEKIFFNFLSQLVDELGIDSKLNLYGGMIKQSIPIKWPPINNYGPINKIIKNIQ